MNSKSLLILRHKLIPSVANIMEASSRAEALEILKREQVAILITNLMMPGMNGLELIRRARSLLPDLRFIVVNATESMDTDLTAMRLGAINYLNSIFRKAGERSRVNPQLTA